MDVVLSALLGALVLVVVWYLSRSGKAKADTDSKSAAPTAEPAKPKPKPASKDITAKPAGQKKSSESEDTADAHPLHLANLKGHQSPITDVCLSADASTVATVSEDRTVRVWSCATFADKQIVYARINAPLDHALACGISADAKYLFAYLANSKDIIAYGVGHGKTKLALQELHQFHAAKQKHTVTQLLVAPNHSWTMTFSKGEDTAMHVYSAKGDELVSFDTRQLVNYQAALSPCGRFVAVGAKLGDVRIWEFTYDKSTGAFSNKVDHVMTLRDHKKGVLTVAFSRDSQLVAAGCGDGNFRLWNISVRYQDKEDPKLLLQHHTEMKEVQYIAISNAYKEQKEVKDRYIVTAACDTTIRFFACSRDRVELLETLERPHKDARISALHVSHDGKLLVTAAYGDKVARVWRVPSLAHL